MNKKETNNFVHRVGFLKLFLSLFAALILLRLFVISVAQHSYYVAQANSQHSYYQKLNPVRGQILISDKYSSLPYPVATNTEKDLVYAVPKDVKDSQATADALAKIISMDPKDVYAKIGDPSRSYVIIKKMLSDQESKAINDAKLAGIYLDQESVRDYPEGSFLSQVLGFVGYKDTGDQKVGLYGLEKYFEKDLAGTPGEISTETDKSGAWITGSQREFIPAQDGTTLQLTIDRAIQYKVESVLAETVQKHGADSGTAIVIDPKTGAILAMASYPSFDPNNYSKATSPSVYQNLATTENYEPGSTMKALTMAAGLDLGVVTPQTTYTDTGVVEIAGYKIKNSDFKGHGIVPMTEVIDHSLNTGAIFVEQQVGNDKFLDYLKKFGLSKATDIELPENIGSLANLQGNTQINYFTASFGQGITATPLQMAQAYVPFANGGKLMQPYIVDSIIYPDGHSQKTEPKVVGQPISAKTASLMTGMLVDDVENGYGKSAGVKGYYLAGKTGTAQVAENGVYNPNDNIGSFIGYGPVDDPKFVMSVVINRPRDVNFAETTAVPAWGEIAQFILNYYNIPPTR